MTSRLLALPLLCLLLSVGSAPHAAAQWPVAVRATMTSSAERVAIGQTFRLQVHVEATGASIDRVELPDLGAFEFLSEQVSRPSQLGFGSGSSGPRMIHQRQTHDMVLRPIRGGRIELSPVQVSAGGQKFQSNPLIIEVIDGGAPPPDPGQIGVPNGDATPGAEGARFDPSGFLQTTITPQSPYVGQQSTLSLYLYVPGRLRSGPELTRKPSPTGFWTQPVLPDDRLIEGELVSVRGRRFRRYLIHQLAAYPLQSGELTIGIPEMRIRTRGIPMLGARPATVLTGVPLRVDVRALPDGAPPNTVVGSHRLQAGLDRQSVRTGDAVTLTATITGEGNIRDIRLALPAVEGIRFLEPRVEDESAVRGARIVSTRRVEWLVIVERPGSVTIPRLAFHQLDPATGAITEVDAGPFTIEAVGPEVTTPTSEAPADPDESPTVADDAPLALGPVRTQSELARHHVPLIERAGFRSGLALPPLAFLSLLLFFFFRRLRDSRADADPSGRSAAAARQTIRRAAAIDGAKDPAGFYGEISHALKIALEGKLGEPVGGLTYPQLRLELAKRRMDEDLVERVIDELESCDFARFSAAGTSEEELERVLKRTRALVTRISGAALDSGGGQ